MRLQLQRARSSSDSIMDGAVQFRKWLAIQWRRASELRPPRGENYNQAREMNGE
jgi:hypothetical protein